MVADTCSASDRTNCDTVAHLYFAERTAKMHARARLIRAKQAQDSVVACRSQGRRRVCRALVCLSYKGSSTIASPVASSHTS